MSQFNKNSTGPETGPQTSPKASPPTAHSPKLGSRAWLKWLIGPYLIAVVFGLAALAAFMSYGLIHASDDANKTLFRILAAGAVVLMGLPFGLFLRRDGPLAILGRTFGAMAMLVGASLVAVMGWFFIVYPAYESLSFKWAMSHLSIEGVSERPIERDGQVIGLRVGLDIKLSSATRVGANSTHIMNTIMSSHLQLAEIVDGQHTSPFTPNLLVVDVSLGGRALDTLPGFARASPSVSWPPQDAMLPAGVYHAERDFYLFGLDRRYDEETPCKNDLDLSADMREPVRKSEGHPIQAAITAVTNKKYRMGRVYFGLVSTPLKFKYQHDAWMATLSGLNIETCAARSEHKKQVEARMKLASDEAKFSAKSMDLQAADNPLYIAMCGDDLNQLTTRLSQGTFGWKLAGKVAECTIDKPRPAFFAAVMPVLYAQQGEREDYCGIVRALHQGLKLAFLEPLVALNLPITCAGAHAHDWRLGLDPMDSSGTRMSEVAPELRLQWFKLLHAQAVKLCVPSTARSLGPFIAEPATITSAPVDPARTSNVLQIFIARAQPALIDLLLDAGCDVSARPMRRAAVPFQEVSPHSVAAQWHSVAAQWALRRFTQQSGSHAIDAPSLARLTKRIGNIPSAEMLEVDPKTGMTIMHDYGSAALEHPDFLAYLVAQGAKLDAAARSVEHAKNALDADNADSSTPGMSWFLPGYRRSHNSLHMEKVALDRLTNAQLILLITPVDSVTGKPGRAMPEVQNYETSGLGSYLIQRGIATGRR